MWISEATAVRPSWGLQSTFFGSALLSQTECPSRQILDVTQIKWKIIWVKKTDVSYIFLLYSNCRWNFQWGQQQRNVLLLTRERVTLNHRNLLQWSGESFAGEEVTYKRSESAQLTVSKTCFVSIWHLCDCSRNHECLFSLWTDAQHVYIRVYGGLEFTQRSHIMFSC